MRYYHHLQIVMMLFNHLLWKFTGEYKLHKLHEKINHLMYMANIKLYQKWKRVRNHSTDSEDIQRRHRDGIWHRKGSMLIIKSGKPQMTEGIEQPNQEKINVRRKGNLQILENIGSRHHQTCRDERENKKEYLWRTRKLFESKLHYRNLIKGINNLAVPPCKILVIINQKKREPADHKVKLNYGLVWFHGISTFFRLFNAKAILLEEQ